MALRSASVTVAPGETLAITGPSGSGKTSLLYCLSGLVVPDSGSVLLDGVIDVHRLTDWERSDLRRSRFGFVFQFAELVPELTLRENVELPLSLNKVSHRSRKSRVADLVSRFGLEDCADRRPATVSGGQAQRAAVARAMAHRPAVVFGDEPTGALDGESGEVVLGAMLAHAEEDGAAVVLVTHSDLVAARADRVVAVRDGETRSLCRCVSLADCFLGPDRPAGSDPPASCSCCC
ncbi:ABC transporter ATP-binding protein [Glycomyces sp. NRRL B-16210]|uniref:ABC transporter ATP-binding protein n=1 Tax=Glycomyces sp. NRRL B-16210 TaxID=1463821 RepID=UPI000B337B87|nr:ATP-binding cassette domain-containing protein [Glycomyces sp. NRRL B-16210]